MFPYWEIDYLLWIGENTIWDTFSSRTIEDSVFFIARTFYKLSFRSSSSVLFYFSSLNFTDFFGEVWFGSIFLFAGERKFLFGESVGEVRSGFCFVLKSYILSLLLKRVNTFWKSWLLSSENIGNLFLTIVP